MHQLDFLIVLTIIVAVFSVLLPIASMFLWSRAEANADRREFNQKMESNMQETRALIDAIHLEIKDFHARLCVIESQRINRGVNDKA